VLVCIDVGARYFKLFATPWTLDVTQYLLYGITFFGAPWVLREDGHIAIEIVVERFRPPARRALRCATDALGAAVCALLLAISCRVLWSSYAQHATVQQTFVFPEWYLYVIPPPVFLILALEFARRAWRPSRASGATLREGD